MNEQLTVLKQVTATLEKADIAYMLTGSMAMNYYVQPRMTRDIDLVVALQPQQAQQVTALFIETFYVDEDMIQQAIVNQSMFNLIHLLYAVKVDCVVRKNTPYRVEEFKRRRPVEFAGIQLWLVSAEDLILSKLVWAKDSRSELQLRDIRNLMTTVTDIDKSYIHQWAMELGVTPLLTQIESP